MPISLSQIPFQLSLLLFSISLVWAVAGQTYYYPKIGRFADIYSRDQESKRLVHLRIVVFCWGSLILLTGFSVWSLFRFALLINLLFSGPLEFQDKIIAVVLPFIYLLIPWYIARFSTSIALLVAAEDYQRKRREEPQAFALGFRASTLKIFDKNPRFAGLMRTIDSGMSLLILLFTPAALKWAYEFSPNTLPLLIFIAIVILAGAFVLVIRYDEEKWKGGSFRDMALLLAKLGVVIFLFTLVSTLKEIDLVEILFFSTLAVWILLAAVFGTPRV